MRFRFSNTEVYPATGRLLREIRRTLNVTVNSVATTLGSAESMISRIETGRCEPPLMHYFMVCFALDIDLSVLVKVVQDHTKDIVSGFNFPYPLRKTTLAIVDVFRDSPTRFIHEAEIATEARLDRNRTDDGIRQLCALGWIQRDTAEGSQRQCYWRLSDQGVQELPQMCAYLDRLHELAMIVINSSRSTVATPHENTATRK